MMFILPKTKKVEGGVGGGGGVFTSVVRESCNKYMSDLFSSAPVHNVFRLGEQGAARVSLLHRGEKGGGYRNKKEPISKITYFLSNMMTVCWSSAWPSASGCASWLRGERHWKAFNMQWTRMGESRWMKHRVYSVGVQKYIKACHHLSSVFDSWTVLVSHDRWVLMLKQPKWGEIARGRGGKDLGIVTDEAHQTTLKQEGLRKRFLWVCTFPSTPISQS